MMLKKIDTLNGNTEASDKLYNEYTRNFRGFVWQNQERPLSGNDVLFKIRLISYQPGKPRKLSGDDGEQLLTQIKDELINLAADKQARTAAEKAIPQLKENKREIAGRTGRRRRKHIL